MAFTPVSYGKIAEDSCGPWHLRYLRFAGAFVICLFFRQFQRVDQAAIFTLWIVYWLRALITDRLYHTEPGIYRTIPKYLYALPVDPITMPGLMAGLEKWNKRIIF